MRGAGRGGRGRQVATLQSVPSVLASWGAAQVRNVRTASRVHFLGSRNGRSSAAQRQLLDRCFEQCGVCARAGHRGCQVLHILDLGEETACWEGPRELEAAWRGDPFSSQGCATSPVAPSTQLYSKYRVMESIDFTQTGFALGAGSESAHGKNADGSKRRVRRVQVELTELQEQLQRKTEELKHAEEESIRLRQKLKVGIRGCRGQPWVELKRTSRVQSAPRTGPLPNSRKNLRHP